MKREQENQNQNSHIKQEQLHDLLFNREIGWQEIIYDLINTEQLDPWNINITILTDKYLEKIRGLEETDFFISSKVLLAAALLLRIKSEILLNKYVRSIDEILFPEKYSGSKGIGLEKGEILTIDFQDVPELIPKSPMPRFRRVTLQELMESLGKAIATENRRIKKEIRNVDALREVDISLPKKKTGIKDRIRELYDKIFQHFEENSHQKRVSFTEFIGTDKENRILSFSPLLHLDHQKKIWLEQERSFDDFHIWLNETYFKNNPDPFADLKEEVEEKIEEQVEESKSKESDKFDPGKKKRLKKIDKDFQNPLGELAE